MRIFVSYASERRDAAQEIALALRERGHRIFFDRTSLVAGDGYDARIEREIRSCDLFVFLVSPEALQSGSYCLTELHHAEARWPHPAGRVLPVLIAPVGFEFIPAYLRAVTVYQPRGKAAAEVAAAVDRLRRPRRWAWVIGGIGGLAGAGFAVAWVYLSPHIALVFGSPKQTVASLLERPDEYQLTVTIANRGWRPVAIERAEIEFAPPANVRQEGVDLSGELEPARERQGVVTLFATGRLQAGTTARVCVWARAREICSPWQAWEPDRSGAETILAPVLAGDAPAALQVASHDEGFAVLRQHPSEVVWTDLEGRELARTPLEGEPTAVTAAPGRVLIGTRGPAALLEFSSENRSLIRQVPVSLPNGDPGSTPISTDPSSIAAQDQRLWVLTRGTAGRPGLAYLRGSEWILPPYYEQIEFNLRDLALRTVDGQIWGSEDATTPASLIRLDEQNMVEFSGHDNDAVSCTRDVADWKGLVLVWTCEQALTALVEADGRLAFAASVGQGPAVSDGAGDWLIQKIGPVQRGCAGGLKPSPAHGERRLRGDGRRRHPPRSADTGADAPCRCAGALGCRREFSGAASVRRPGGQTRPATRRTWTTGAGSRPLMDRPDRRSLGVRFVVRAEGVEPPTPAV